MPLLFSFVVYFRVGVNYSCKSYKIQEEQGHLGEEIPHFGHVGARRHC
jgi:hypothetical protein